MESKTLGRDSATGRTITRVPLNQSHGVTWPARRKILEYLRRAVRPPDRHPVDAIDPCIEITKDPASQQVVTGGVPDA